MKWSEDYATGIQRVDQQHKLIFRMASDFRLALEEGSGGRSYDSLLLSLDAYCKGHFQFEEQCMTEYRCPMAEKNASEHAEFLSTLHRFRERFDAAGYSASDARDLITTLEQWLENHICRIDVHLRDCVNG